MAQFGSETRLIDEKVNHKFALNSEFLHFWFRPLGTNPRHV